MTLSTIEGEYEHGSQLREVWESLSQNLLCTRIRSLPVLAQVSAWVIQVVQEKCRDELEAEDYGPEVALLDLLG